MNAPLAGVPRITAMGTHVPSTSTSALFGPVVSYQFAHAWTELAWRG
jgi:hypothetical protein